MYVCGKVDVMIESLNRSLKCASCMRRLSYLGLTIGMGL